MSGAAEAGGRTRLLSLRGPAVPAQLKVFRRGLNETLAGIVGEDCRQEIVLAVDEACQNVIRHAYGAAEDGEIVLEIHRAGDELELTIRDFAPPVDPTRIRPRALDDVRPGGLGTHFIRETMDEVVYQQPPDGTGNLLRMVKKIG